MDILPKVDSAKSAVLAESIREKLEKIVTAAPAGEVTVATPISAKNIVGNFETYFDSRSRVPFFLAHAYAKSLNDGGISKIFTFFKCWLFGCNTVERAEIEQAVRIASVAQLKTDSKRIVNLSEALNGKFPLGKNTANGKADFFSFLKEKGYEVSEHDQENISKWMEANLGFYGRKVPADSWTLDDVRHKADSETAAGSVGNWSDEALSSNSSEPPTIELSENGQVALALLLGQIPGAFALFHSWAMAEGGNFQVSISLCRNVSGVNVNALFLKLMGSPQTLVVNALSVKIGREEGDFVDLKSSSALEESLSKQYPSQAELADKLSAGDAKEVTKRMVIAPSKIFTVPYGGENSGGRWPSQIDAESKYYTGPFVAVERLKGV